MPQANTSLTIWAFTFLCACIWHTYQVCSAFGVNYWQSSCEKLSGAVSRRHSTGSRAHRWRQYLNPNCTERRGNARSSMGTRAANRTFVPSRWHMAWCREFVLKLDRFDGFHPFEMGSEGIQIKSLPVNPDVHSGWMHENVTDAQRRQKGIWSYIMTLTSAQQCRQGQKGPNPFHLLHFRFNVSKKINPKIDPNNCY